MMKISLRPLVRWIHSLCFRVVNAQKGTSNIQDGAFEENRAPLTQTNMSLAQIMPPMVKGTAPQANSMSYEAKECATNIEKVVTD